jgi:calcineurin-like phosphoesterase family protein
VCIYIYILFFNEVNTLSPEKIIWLLGDVP